MEPVKNVGGRPPKSADEKRTVRVEVLLNAAEKAQLDRLVSEAGVKGPGEYLRRLLPPPSPISAADAD